MTTTTNVIFKGKYYYGTGRRKTASARVRLYEGRGVAMINGKLAEAYLNPKGIEDLIWEPLVLVGLKNNYDISARVMGGGPRSQAEAVRHGVARAILKIDAALKKTLKSNKLLTRDSRVKERKKYGLKRARRAPQFSKR